MMISKPRLLRLLLLLLLRFLESRLLRPGALLLIWVGHRIAMLLLVVGRLVLLPAEAPSVWRHVLVRRRAVLRLIPGAVRHHSTKWKPLLVELIVAPVPGLAGQLPPDAEVPVERPHRIGGPSR